MCCRTSRASGRSTPRSRPRRQARLSRSRRGGASGPDPASFSTLHAYREEAEKQFIIRKLKEYRWNISRMAKAIETPRSNLYKKLEQYGISRDQVGE